MTADNVIDLLTLVAAYDQRTVGHDDVQAWLLIANAEDWTLPRARRAVVEHHRRGADRPRLRPAHITDALDDLRRTISRSALRVDLTPPRHLADHPRAEIAWRRERAEALIDAGMDAWARGEQLPDPAALTRLVGHEDGDLVAERPVAAVVNECAEEIRRA